MKILPFSIPKPEKTALIFQEDQELVFYDKLHQHTEIQISYIAEGEGTLIVGDTINYYMKGDVLIIGSNLPHVFKSDIKKDEHSHMLSLFFAQDAFGVHFFDLDELKSLVPFFHKASYGFKVNGIDTSLGPIFSQLKNESKLSQFLTLLKIMDVLAHAPYQHLSSFIYEKKYSAIEGKRMRDIMEYTTTNFHEDISLAQIATVAAMTKNAFCKYFKKRTNKTYVQFLNELRVEHACKLLLASDDQPISEISLHSGFNTISNFNRQFRSLKGINPKAFKKEHHLRV